MSRFEKAARMSMTAREFQISSALAISSGFILPAIQSALTLGVHEVLNNPDVTGLGMLALGAITLAANVASVYVESQTLKKKGYSNSPVTTGAYKLVEKPGLISVGSHLYHLAILGLINPVNLMTFANIVSGSHDTGRLLVENALSVATTNAAWNLLTEGLILKGKIDPLANKLDHLNHIMIEKIKPPAQKLVRFGGKIISKTKPLADKIKEDIHLYFDG